MPAAHPTEQLTGQQLGPPPSLPLPPSPPPPPPESVAGPAASRGTSADLKLQADPSSSAASEAAAARAPATKAAHPGARGGTAPLYSGLRQKGDDGADGLGGTAVTGPVGDSPSTGGGTSALGLMLMASSFSASARSLSDAASSVVRVRSSA